MLTLWFRWILLASLVPTW